VNPEIVRGSSLKLEAGSWKREVSGVPKEESLSFKY
jgi:hypothetical protein